MSEQDEKRQDEAPADEAPAAGRRVPLATVVIATLLSLAIAGLVAGLLIGVGEKKDDPNIVTLDNDVASVPSLGEGEDTVGRPAPTSDYTTFDGEEASVADYAGTPMVVNFFASWCTPCIKEMPDFEQVHQALGDQVTFVGINSTDRIEDGTRIAEQAGVTYDLLADTNGDLLAELEGVGMPVTLLVDADGTIVETRTGGLDAEELTTLLGDELGVR